MSTPRWATEQLERIIGTPRHSAPETYRCGECLDVGWIETDASGRGTWKRCRGKSGQGCPHDSHKVAQAMKRRDHGQARPRELKP